MTDLELYEELYSRAVEARGRAYCPYSGVSVGAALLDADGNIYTGANIENAAFSPTVCAERVAFFTAVHSGARNFRAIAVAGGRADGPARPEFTPCGVCRQVMAELSSPDLVVITGGESGIICNTLGELLPAAFDKEKL